MYEYDYKYKYNYKYDYDYKFEYEYEAGFTLSYSMCRPLWAENYKKHHLIINYKL